MSLGEITGISLNKKKLQIQTGKTKYVFTGINDVNKLNGILVPLWQDATSKEVLINILTIVLSII